MARRNRNQQQASTTMSEDKALDTEVLGQEQPEAETSEEMTEAGASEEMTTAETSDQSPENQQEPEAGDDEEPVGPEEEDEEPSQENAELAPAPAAAPVAAPVAAPAPEPVKVADNDPLAFLKGRLDTYAKKMNKRNVWDAKVGVSQQRLLLDTINSTFRMDSELFVPAWKYLVEFAKANRSDCFGDLYIFRGFADLGLVDTVRKRAEFLIQFILVSADTSIAKAASMVNVDHLSTRGLTSAEVDTLMLLFPNEQ